ncbi:hemin receptor [Soonwooa sp.]|uniref:OmpP1/FadL family transporter n=1 Tax=Soonwooa sp. TaxID=1938592 RepID=UPI00260955AE|nr:hemin receptor [Soonwooa sp.]
MLKRTLLILTLPAAFYLQAQDISEIRNTTDVYNNNSINGTAKYVGMAGSMGALGGDISSVSTNPAGLGVNIASDLSLSLSTFSNKNTSTIAGKSASNTTNKTDLGNASAIISFDLSNLNSKWKFVNVGVSYNSSFLNEAIGTPGNSNIVIQKDLIDANNNPLVGNLSYQGHVYNRDGRSDKTNFTIGANYDNKIYLGAGVNMSNISYSQDDYSFFHLDANNVTDSFEKQYTPYLEQAKGFSANFGIIGKISNQFRLGAAIETPTWWNIDRVFREYGTANDGYINSSDFSESRDLRTPFKATLSAAFVPSKNFAFNVDYIQGLSKPKYTTTSAVNTDLNAFYNQNYNNSSEVRLGAEYRYEGFRLRAGYAFANNPFNNMMLLSYNDAGAMQDSNYSNLMLSKRNTLGVGLGYDFKAFYIDAAYQNVSSEYNNPFLYGSAANGTGYYSNNFDVNSPAYAVSKVKNQMNNLVFTLGWKF